VCLLLKAAATAGGDRDRHGAAAAAGGSKDKVSSVCAFQEIDAVAAATDTLLCACY